MEVVSHHSDPYLPLDEKYICYIIMNWDISYTYFDYYETTHSSYLSEKDKEYTYIISNFYPPQFVSRYCDPSGTHPFWIQ